MGRRNQRKTPNAASSMAPGQRTAGARTPASPALQALEPGAAASPPKPRRLPILLMVCAVWLYVGLWIDPPLRHHLAGPIFFLRFDFFTDHLDRTGGLVKYAAAWLAQMDCRAMLGAFVTTVLIGLVSGASALLLNRAGRCHPLTLCVPGLLLLVLAGRHDFPFQETALSVLLAVSTAAAWQIRRPARLGARWAGFWLATTGLFYVAGPIPAALFVVLGTVWEAVLASRPGLQTADRSLRRTPESTGTAGATKPASEPVRQVRAPSGTPMRETPGHPRTAGLIGVLMCGLAVALIAVGILAVPDAGLAQLVSGWGRGVPLAVCVLLYVFLPCALWFFAAGTGTRLAGEPDPTGQGKNRRVARGLERLTRAPRWSWWAGGLAVAVGVLALSSDANRTASLRIEWAAQEGRWEQALEAARNLHQFPGPAARMAIHRALYQTGRLTQDLFSFPQRRGLELLPSMREGIAVCAPLSDTLLELGQVGWAEHFAHEALENAGPRPHLLWQLARINVLQGRPQAARVFLNRLRQVPFQRERADRRLEALAADPALTSEPDIARVRAWMVTTDYAESSIPTEFLLRQLLQSNRRNRMAFEFLMAHHLLGGRTDAVVQGLGTLDDHGLWETPRHIEEAMIEHLAAKGGATAELAGRRVSADTVRRHSEFQTRVRQYGGRATGRETQLATEFGETFWFYQLFGATFGSVRPNVATSPP